MPVVYLALVYLLAAVPFGLVITTLYGGDVDVRAAGSGNIGATNVARVYGWTIAVPVLLLDALKGLLPVLLAPFVWDAGLPWQGLVGLVAFIGHCWPVYLEFRGGKGVATGAGMMLGLAPVPTLFAIALWGAVLGLTGRSSIAALVATAGLVGLTGFLAFGALPFAGLLAIGILVRHTSNIGRIVRGEEQQVVRGVRWNRRATGPSAEAALAQGPAGGDASEPVWRERVEDPLKGDDEGGAH